jgi:glycosyltransferase involved in cell wall biosynthesis
MPNPLVSVVIPSYNRAQYIAETIESVLAQTYREIEVIVIDDGSTDNTRDAVEPYVPHVKYVRQKNSERGASRNHGLRLAKGEFIAFLDSDDLWLPQKLEEDLKILKEKPRAGVVYSDADLVDSDGDHLKTLKRKGYTGSVTDQLLTDNFVSIGAHLIRKSFADQIGGFREERELSGSEDWEFWVRLSCVTEFEYLPKATTRIRTHQANTMSDAAAMSRSMGYALKLVREGEYLSARQKGLLRTMQAKMALVNAINLCSGGKYRETFDHLVAAARCSPGVALDPRYPYTILRMLIRPFRR